MVRGDDNALPHSARIRLAAQGGVASAHQLKAHGLSRHTIAALVKAEQLVRFHRDVLVDADVWDSSAPWERHLLRARGVMCALQPGGEGPYALSHHSALALHGVPVHGVDDRAHLVRTDGGRGRSDSGLQVHAPLAHWQVMRVAGRRVVTPALACLQVAGTFGAEAGLVSTDAALRQGQVAAGELAATARTGSFGRGVAQVRTVARHADGRSESAGESRCRWLIHALGLPRPELQTRIYDGQGRLVGRVDFCFHQQRTVVEFDGLAKYQSAADLQAEKRWEDRLREQGYEVVRLTWADLADPLAVEARIVAAFVRGARRGVPEAG